MIENLIHFYKKGAEPFRTLSSLPQEEAIQIMQALYVEGSVFWERFKDPADYLKERLRIEQKLRKLFISKGGRPRDPSPIYMILGRTRWLQAAADAVTLATTAEIQVPLSLFQEGEISFTYPDSMVSFWLADLKDAEYYLPEYHGKVFTLPEIRSIVETNGLPGETWGNKLPENLANYIEAQVWNREPLVEFKQQLIHPMKDFPRT